MSLIKLNKLSNFFVSPKRKTLINVFKIDVMRFDIARSSTALLLLEATLSVPCDINVNCIASAS